MDLENVVAIISSVVMLIVSLILLALVIDTYRLNRKREKERSAMEREFHNLICELATESNEEDDASNTNYEHMNVSELKAIAKQRKIKGYYRLKRKDLLKVLK